MVLISTNVSNKFSVWNLLLNPVSNDNPTENLKECDLVENVISDAKFGFTCENVNGKLGLINLPHIPKSQDYAAFDNRKIKILQADRFDEYLVALENNSFYDIFQNSSCDGLAGHHANEQIVFEGSFEDDSCLAQSQTIIDENGDHWDIKQ